MNAHQAICLLAPGREGVYILYTPNLESAELFAPRPYHCTLSSFQPQMWMAGLSDTLDRRAASEAASRQEGEAGRWVLGL